MGCVISLSLPSDHPKPEKLFGRSILEAK